MNLPEGKIVSVNDGATGRRALVDVDIASACPRCAEGKGCGAGVFTGRERRRQVEASIPAGLDLKAGDDVRLGLAPSNVLAAALVVYGWPMAGAIVGVLLSFGLGLGDAAAAVAALAGLAAGATLARWRLRARRCLERFTPRILPRTPA